MTHEVGSRSSALQTSNHLHIHDFIVSLTVVRQVSFHNSVNKEENTHAQKKRHPKKGTSPKQRKNTRSTARGRVRSCLPCICCLIQTGHPQPSCYSGPSVLWRSLPGPTGAPSDAQGGWHRGQSANPYLLHCCTTAEPVLTRATKHTPSVKHTCRGFWPTWIAPTTVFVTFTPFMTS